MSFSLKILKLNCLLNVSAVIDHESHLHVEFVAISPNDGLSRVCEIFVFVLLLSTTKQRHY